MPILFSDRTREHYVRFGQYGMEQARYSYCVSDIDTSSPQTTLRSIRGTAGLPNLGDLAPGESGILGLGCRAKSMWVGETDGVNAWVYVDYDNYQEIRGIFHLEETTRVIDRHENRLPDGTPIFVSGYTAGTPPRTIPGKLMHLPVRRPVRVLESTGVGLTDSTGSVSGNVGTVNDSAWNGLPPGYWLCVAAKMRRSVIGEERSIYLAFETLIDHPWTQDVYLPNPLTGEPVTDGSGMSMTYFYGLQQATGGGAAVVGPYRAVNYQSIFGSYVPNI